MVTASDLQLRDFESAGSLKENFGNCWSRTVALLFGAGHVMGWMPFCCTANSIEALCGGSCSALEVWSLLSTT